MVEHPPARRLTTIVALDVAGYSARIEADEARTTAEVAALRGVIEALAAAHGGRVFNTGGDGFMLEFGSSVAAVEAAFALADRCEPRVRVGVHLGDVVVQPDGDLLGHGVNVAARLMARSDPGSVLVSADVRRTIRGPLAERLVSRGPLRLDKMAETIEVFGPGAGAPMLRPVTYRFGRFELDLARAELRADGTVQPLEPQVFALLVLLVENGERLVSKDEIVEKVWDRRIVSDSAIASRIKSARRALGDDGKAQRFIKTVHGRGVRFVAPVTAARGAAPLAVAMAPGTHVPAPADAVAQPSIAVLPFRLVGPAGPWAAIAEALPHELIAELSRLRWLSVTARGSSFRLRAAETDLEEVGRLLGVRYCLTGTVEIAGSRLTVTTELADTRRASIVWAERFAGALDDVHRVRDDIRGRILAELDIRIPSHEAALARLAVPDDLDAWAAFHLGLQHMYRFNRGDNAAARALFERAVDLEPGFARAHAGLSFVHFQTAFLRHTDDLAGEIALARGCAERGLELDALDPFVNFTMGRSFWLIGDLDGGLAWLERATTISPSYVHGIYARGWTESLAGRGAEGREHVDLAMRLSPLDPLYYAMLGTRALAHLALGEDAEAASWAECAARSPGAHVLIAMIAAAATALCGDDARAAAWAADVRARNPMLHRGDFFRAFPMQPQALKRRVSKALARLGF